MGLGSTTFCNGGNIEVCNRKNYTKLNGVNFFLFPLLIIDASNILIVRFEEMKKDLHKSIRTISQFMGYDLDEATINAIAEECTFDRMKANPLLNLDTSRYTKIFNKDRTFMRKGVVGDWKNHLSPEQTAQFDTVYHKKIDGSGLDFGI